MNIMDARSEKNGRNIVYINHDKIFNKFVKFSSVIIFQTSEDMFLLLSSPFAKFKMNVSTEVLLENLLL